MTCIKTGATVHFANYNMAVPADIFRVGDCYVIRWNVNGQVYRELEHSDWAVAPYEDSAKVWHREDLGVTVVPKEFLIAPPEVAAFATPIVGM